MFQNQPISSPGFFPSKPSSSLPARMAPIDSSSATFSLIERTDRVLVAIAATGRRRPTRHRHKATAMRASSTAASLRVAAAGEFGPRHQRLLGLLQRRRGPTEAEQGLVGQHARQAHALEEGARRLGLRSSCNAAKPSATLALSRRARELFGRAPAPCPARRAWRCRRAMSPDAHQRDAEVVARIQARGAALGHRVSSTSAAPA